MDSSWIDATLAWIAAHPVLAGAVIFLIAFCDAVIILGAIVPALPLLFAVGVFIGLPDLRRTRWPPPHWAHSPVMASVTGSGAAG